MDKLRRCIFCILISFILSSNPLLSANLPITEPERAWIAKKYVVRIRVGEWPPFMFSTKEFKGLCVDYIKKIFELHGIRYRFISDKDVPWKKALEYIKKHEVVDLLLAAKITDERKQYMVFTDEYLFMPCVIFSRIDSPFIGGMDYLAGKTVCVPDGYAIQGLIAKEYPKVNLKPISGYNMETLCIKALSNGYVDAYVGNLAVGSYIIQSNGYTNLKVAAPTPFESNNQAMAIRDDWPELASIISKTLKHFTPAEHAEIRNNWLFIRFEHGLRIKDIFKWVGLVASVLFVLLLFTIFWNRRLNKEIKERMELEEKLQISEKRYRSLSDAAFEGIMISHKGYILDANETIIKMLGYPRAGFVNRSYIDFLSPEDRENVMQKMLSGDEKLYESKILKKDGSFLPVEIRARMFSDKGGRMLRVTSILDITEKKRAEEEIKTLKGILPICMHCKEIRDDHGYWNRLEKYISEHSEAEFSHSICDKCLKKYYSHLVSD